MGDSIYRPDKKLVFSETFESESTVRRNGGVLTAVTFSKGRASFNGSTSCIDYNKRISGTHTVRLKLTTTASNTTKAIIYGKAGSDYYESYFNVVGAISAPFATKRYIDGVDTADAVFSPVLNKEYDICFVFPISVNSMVLAQTNSHAFPAFVDISLFEIYTGTLTADEVKNLYENKRYAVSDFNHTEQLGPELITNGTFDSDAGWSISAPGWVITGGTATHSNAYNGTSLSTTLLSGMTAGKYYKFEIDVIPTTPTGGTRNLLLILGSTGYVIGETYYYSLPDGNTKIIFRSEYNQTFVQLNAYNLDPNDSKSFSVTNVSIKEVVVHSAKEILNVSALNGVITNRYSGEVYQNNLIPEASSQFTTDGTAWWGIGDGTKTWNSNGYMTINPCYCWLYKGILYPPKQYYYSFSIRGEIGVSATPIAGATYGTAHTISIANTWQDFSGLITPSGGDGNFYIQLFNGNTIDIDNITLKEVIPSPVSTDVQVVKENGIYAMKFNKNSYSNINCGSYDTLVGDKTFVYWNKGKKDTADTYIMSNGNFHIDEKTSGESLLYITNDNWNGVVYSVSFTLATYLNRWKHIVVTRKSSGVVQIYLNGVAQTMGVIAGGTITPGTNIIIGYSNSYNPFDGHIGSLSIYDGILTSQEIAQMYSSEKHLYGL